MMYKYRCEACGYHPGNTAIWCAMGCGRDFYRMNIEEVSMGKSTVNTVQAISKLEGLIDSASLIGTDAKDPIGNFIYALNDFIRAEVIGVFETPRENESQAEREAAYSRNQLRQRQENEIQQAVYRYVMTRKG